MCYTGLIHPKEEQHMLNHTHFTKDNGTQGGKSEVEGSQRYCRKKKLYLSQHKLEVERNYQ